VTAVVQTTALSRRYGTQWAVDSLDMQVREGEVYGFLGLNGAGKTTTIRMLMGLIRPTLGHIELLGHEVPRDRMKVMGAVGSLVESPSYYAHLSGWDNLKIMATLLDVPDERIREVLKVVDLTADAEKKAGQYSLGMRQRLGIASALLNRPRLLVLDEPTNGLDPAGIQEMRNLIVRLPREHGITVLVSSHLLSEIDQMATSVGVIHHGRMLFQGPIDELRHRSSASVSIKVDRPAEAQLSLAHAGIDAVPDGGALTLASVDPQAAAAAVRALVNDDIAVYRVEEHKPTLEDIFLALTSGVDAA